MNSLLHISDLKTVKQYRVKLKPRSSLTEIWQNEQAVANEQFTQSQSNFYDFVRVKLESRLNFMGSSSGDLSEFLTYGD